MLSLSGTKRSSSAKISVGADARAVLLLKTCGTCWPWSDRCGTKAKGANKARRDQTLGSAERVGPSNGIIAIHSRLSAWIHVGAPNRARLRRVRRSVRRGASSHRPTAPQGAVDGHARPSTAPR